MARVAAVERQLVCGCEFRAVFLRDRHLHAGEAAHVEGVEDRLQVDIAVLIVLPDRADEDRPLHVAARFVEVELGQPPVLLLGREPQVGPVVPDVDHRVRLRGDEHAQPLEVGGGRTGLRGGRCGKAVPAPQLHRGAAEHGAADDESCHHPTRDWRL